MNHTPTPWIVAKEENTLDGITDLAIRFAGGKIDNKTVYPFRVATVNTAYFGAHEAEAIANAEFIVRACNCHEELLAACKRALLAFEAMPPTVNEDRYEPLMALKAAIAKANA